MQVKRWEALGDGICDAAALAYLEGRRAQGERSQAWIDRQREKIIRCMEVVSEDIGDRQWCHGNSFSLADVSIGCALGYLLLRFPDINWRGQHPNLGRMYDKLMHRPSFAETVPRG
jgi:glutathione S-transferase